MVKNVDFNQVEMSSHRKEFSMNSVSKGSLCCFVGNKRAVKMDGKKPAFVVM